MIFTERTITVVNDSATINKPLILYRGDKNIELKITIAESQFKFRNNDASNVIETTDASYAQLVINTPYNSPIFSDVAVTKNGAVIFVITEAMIDEIREVGAYEIQIRLLDDNKQSRASIPPVINAIEIREPIAIEDGSVVDSNAVNVAKVNRALTTTSAPLEAFDSQGNYIKKTWGDGDPITDAALNKMEAGIDGVNKKVVTKTSQLTNDANYASESFVTNKIAEAQLGGGSGSVDLSGYVTKETGNASQITFADGQTFQAKLDAGILKGDKGDKGDTGATGANGQTPNIAMGTVTTLDAGTNATAEITGTIPNLTLNLGIPKGANGQDGAAADADLSKLSLNLNDKTLSLKNNGTNLSSVTLPEATVTDEQVNNAIQSKIDDGTLSALSIEDNSVTPNKTTFFKESLLNVFNKDDGNKLVDKDYEWNGVIKDRVGYITYDVEVKPNTVYYFNKEAFEPSSYNGVFLDSNKNYINYSGMCKYDTATSITTPENTSYLRCCCASDDIGIAWISEIELTEYVPYGTKRFELSSEYTTLFSDMLKGLQLFANSSELIALQQNLDDINNSNIERLRRLENGADDMYLYCGNWYEQPTITFCSPYEYKLIPKCSWCSPNENTYVNAQNDDARVSLKGLYKLETYDKGELINPESKCIRYVYGIISQILGRKDIIFIGDSLSDTSFSTYPYNYISKLEKLYKHKYNFITSIPRFGEKTSEQYSKLKSLVENVYEGFSTLGGVNQQDIGNTQFICIFIGTNDIDTTDLTTFETTYSEMVDFIKTKFINAKILLITPYLCKKSSNSINYINKIKEIATSKACEIMDLSAYSQLDSVTNEQNEYYLEAECIHLTEAGWNLINDDIINKLITMGL